MSIKTKSVTAVVAVILMAGSSQLAAQSFSIDAMAPGILPPIPDDILAPGPPVPLGTTPPPIPFPGPILMPGAGVEVDAFCWGIYPVFVPDGANFSVGPGSVGVAGSAVFVESGGDEPADLFYSSFGGGNVQTHDGNGVPVGLPLGLPEPLAANLDAVDMLPPILLGPPIFFSVDPGTAAGPYLGASAADIFVAPFGPGPPVYSLPLGLPPPVLILAAGIGLLPGDDIDALFWMDDGAVGATAGDMIYFSLAPGSPSLGAIGATPADILLTSPGAAAPVIFMPAPAIGLLPTDNLDALDMHAPGEDFPVMLQSFDVE